MLLSWPWQWKLIALVLLLLIVYVIGDFFYVNVVNVDTGRAVD